MKQFYFFLFCLCLSGIIRAEDGNRAKGAKSATQGCAQFKFNQLAPGNSGKDSVLIIFDRFDRTGAGVIYQVFYADQDMNIIIPEIPAGKYFVTIQCLGMHRDRLEKVVTIKSQKNEKVKISLQNSEEFSKENVIIPAFKFNSGNLAILRSK